MIDLHPRLRDEDYFARMIVQVHDEVVIRVDERHVFEAMPLVVDTMSGVKGADGYSDTGPGPTHRFGKGWVHVGVSEGCEVRSYHRQCAYRGACCCG